MAPTCSAYEFSDRCGQPAEYVLTMSCACHGVFRHGLCEKHTAEARAGKFCCTEGREPTVVMAARSLGMGAR